jgi:hypothetical protein
MLASQDFTKLATALSTDFTLHVPDRRGLGLSGLGTKSADYLGRALRKLVVARELREFFGYE